MLGGSRGGQLSALLLDQRYQSPLRVAVAVDVPLRRLNRAVSGQELNISQRSARLMNQPSCAGDKRPSPGMRGAAIQFQHRIGTIKPDYNAMWGHAATTL